MKEAEESAKAGRRAERARNVSAVAPIRGQRGKEDAERRKGRERTAGKVVDETEGERAGLTRRLRCSPIRDETEGEESGGRTRAREGTRAKASKEGDRRDGGRDA
jgi:hypothetical protein